MASTYSDLKVELIGTGEQSGTWGTTTNTNLSVALGEAITGSADVTFASANATITLTDTNGAQAARNLRLNLTGTSSGTHYLILGSGCNIEKLYLVNNTLGNAIIVQNTGGGTGVTVPAGKSMFVYNTGTNVVDATTHLTSLTLGTDLAVADGGTGSSTLTAENVILGNGTNAVKFVAPGTSGNILTSNGTTWTSSAPPASGVTTFSAGTTGLTPNSASNGAITLAGTLNVANGGTSANTLTAENVIIGNGTNAVKFVAPGTNGNVLTSNGTAWTSVAAATPSAFPAGTRLAFQQTSAPTGWTKDTTAAINDAVLRLVTGSVSSGGSTAFSTFNGQTTTGSTTLSTSQIPSHTHTVSVASSTPAAPAGIQSSSNYGGTNVPTGATGGGGSHNHSMTTNIKYYDFIIASKD